MGSPSPNPTSEVPDTFMPRAPAARRQLVRLIGEWRNTVVVHRLLSRNHEVEIVETNRRGHAIRFAQDAARRGLDAVVAFGGDGTLNEVATGLAGTTTALAVLPGGSTNVFARTIGVANDPIVATNGLLAGLQEDRVEPIGLGASTAAFLFSCRDRI